MRQAARRARGVHIANVFVMGMMEMRQAAAAECRMDI